MNSLIKTFGELETQIHPEYVRHSNGHVGVPTIGHDVDVSTIARNVDADNCIEGLQLWFQSGKTSYWSNKMLFHVKPSSKNVVSRETECVRT